ncbi:uncharacterized protein LOC112979290 isoform X2 [Dromaius novaehollandiae]|uniref:uncharacterized protein LOC112979290 isoform X2 n=1 Tax=Dromaius novaehollandiae TaxID=8790 RepID=UPI00311E5A3B
MPSLFTLQAALCALVILEAHSDVTTIDKRVCDSVIFDLHYPQLDQLSRITWYKGNTSLKHWTRGNAVSSQRIHVYPNGALGIRSVVKEDVGWYTAIVRNSSEHLLYQKVFQLRVHEHLVRRLVGDCFTFDLNCLQPDRYIHVTWKKGEQRVAKMRGQRVDVSASYRNRAHAFLNGSLTLCPMQWGDKGKYVAEIFDQDGVHMHHEIINLELNKMETFKETTEFIGGSMFLNLTEMKLRHFQVVWKKENTEVARTSGFNFWYHEDYVNRSEIVSNYSLRLDRIQKSDQGIYSIEVNDRDGRTVYESTIRVKVEQNETSRRNYGQLLFYVLITSQAVVIIIILVVLIWHFKNNKHRSVWIRVPRVPSFRHMSSSLTDERDNPEKPEETDENSLCLQNDENSSVQGPDGTSCTEQRSEGLLSSNKEANPVIAESSYTEQATYFLVSTFQTGKRLELPHLNGMKAGKPPASVSEVCVAPHFENIPPGSEDCVLPEFDYPLPSVYDGCLSPEFDLCSPPGSEDLKEDDYVAMHDIVFVSPGAREAWERSEDNFIQYASIK